MNSKFIGFIKNVSEKVYKYFGKDSGKMLLAANIIGILSSSFAQAGAILLNKDYSSPQKKFLIPHELIDGLLMVGSIFIVTRPLQCFSKKIIKSGKILTKDMAEYLEKNNLNDKRGTLEFDFTKNVKEIMAKIETSDNFIKSSEIEKEKLLKEHREILNNYDTFEDSVSAITTTIGTMTSFSLVSPFLRNYALSKLPCYDKNEPKANPKNITFKQFNMKTTNNNYYHPLRYRNNLSLRENSRFSCKLWGTVSS